MQALALTLLAVLLMAPFSAHAQAGDKTAATTPTHPVWWVEKPFADTPLLTARTAGHSTYGDNHEEARLRFTCYAQSPTVNLALEINPESLAFDIEPFEGPTARANGPLGLSMGTRPAVNGLVNGVWNYPGAFEINASVPQGELAYWLSDASRGQTLNLSLAPATVGGKPLTATFVLPADNGRVKKMLQSCLNATSSDLKP